MPNGDREQLESKLAAVERVTKLFQAERWVYMCFSIAAFVMLLICLVALTFGQHQNMETSLAAFGSSGVVAFTSSRVLLMWQRAIAVISGLPEDAK